MGSNRHLLRNIGQCIDVEFIRERVRHLYCSNNGHPALDRPCNAVQHTVSGVSGSIRGECQLLPEIKVNVACCWLSRFNLTDKITDGG